ncbi:coiled-coil domain-containing protein 30 isoform X2 [Hoplias malabaricus]|uniref:coiled-coil domain-containing protein 30 isoform X2 n=1 Tax=Hoplias malabaricus TaxID=27720 RepID=UPI003461A10E
MEQEEVAVMLAELQKKGLGPEASNSECLSMLWRLYLERESSIGTLTQEIQELRAERAAEINTVQQYVENIRSLSKTRDSVALELEQDNEMLRSQLVDISLQQEAQKREIAEMLLQEGLAEVIPSSLSEQVAYLLAERASLLEVVDTKSSQNCAPKNISQGFEEVPGKVDNQGSCSEENMLKERERYLLERDLNEASSRLDMAHKEIRRLTDELESARLTQRAYEPELQEAQREVEQLRQEVEKLKRCDVAELRRAKEINEALDAEVHQLRASVHRMHTEHIQLLELVDSKIEDLDSEDDVIVQDFFHKLTKNHVGDCGSLSEIKKKKENDIHDRSCTELEDLKQSVLKLQTELEEERTLRKKAMDEYKDQSKRRAAAEQLIQELRALCEEQQEKYKVEVQQFQEKVVADLQDAQAKVKQLEEKEAAQCTEIQAVQLQLQRQQTQWNHDKSLFQKEHEELCSARVQFSSMRKEIKDLQQQLKSTTQQLHLEETHNEQNSRLEQTVRVMVEELDTLKTHAENAQKQGEHLAMREKELLQQVESLLTTNTQLTLTNAESSRVQDQQNKEQSELRQIIKNLEGSLMSSQQGCENLQIQLQHTHFNLQSQISKYQDKKDRHKLKLAEAKEVYLRETAWRDEKIREQQRELRILSKRLEKENEMVKKITAENEKLLLNKKQLLCQLNEEEESRNHAVDALKVIQQRVDFLEKDSVQQWDLNMRKSKQIVNLESLLQDKKCLISTKDLKKLSSFENRIIEGSEQASFSERGFATFDFLAVIQETKPKSKEEPAAMSQSRASERGYLN